MSIKTLAFDFGNVIGFFSHQRAAERLAAHTTLSAAAIYERLLLEQMVEDYETGRLTTSEVLRLVSERCELGCPEEEVRDALGDIFWPNDDVCSLIPLLKPRYRLLLASNTNELHAARFRPQFAPTLEHFDELVLSHLIGARKPRPEFFAQCQRRAGCAPHECLFIDDLPANVAGARAFGWNALLYRAGNDLRQQLASHGVDVPGSTGTHEPLIMPATSTTTESL